MYNSPNSLDINIKNTNNTNTHINFNFNIGSTLEKKFLSPSLKSTKEPGSSITGRKIEQNNILNCESSLSKSKYPILIEDSKKKPPPKLTQGEIKNLKKTSPKKNKSMGTLPTAKMLENAKFLKKPQNLLSPPNEINKLMIANKEASTTKTKRKSKKKKASSKKKKSQTSKDLHQMSSFRGDFSQFQLFLRKNLKKYQSEKTVAEQKKREEGIQKDMRQQFLNQHNQATRKLNSQSNHQKNGSVPKFPWGFNQKKYLSFFEKMAEINSQKSLRKKPVSLWWDEKARRERLGLGFLNEMNMDDFQRIIQRQKQDGEEEKPNDSKKAPKESNPEILAWMIEKKRRMEEEKWNSLKMMIEEQQRIRRNMQELETKVVNNRVSVKSSSVVINGRSKYAKSSHNMGKMFMDEKNQAFNKALPENEESKIYDLLQNQVQQIVYSNNQLPDFISIHHAKSKSEDFQGKLLQKKRNIQEQFQLLSQKMAEKLGMIKSNSKTASPELKSKENSSKLQGMSGSSPEKNQSKELPNKKGLTKVPSLAKEISNANNKFLQNPDFLHENEQKNQNPKVSDLKLDFKPAQSSKKTEINQEIQRKLKVSLNQKEKKQTSENSPSLSESQKTPIKRDATSNEVKRYQEKEEEVIMEENPLDFASEEEEMLYILNTAATIIQKVWKGYKTRKMLNYYVLMALKEMNPEIIESPIENDTNTNNDEVAVESSKKHHNIKNMRRSHSLDEIYEAGNLFKENEMIPQKNKNESPKLDPVFNEQEREEFNKKLRLLNNKTGEDFDYYQIGGKNEEVQFDIKASENLPKIIDNNLFYGRKNESSDETKPIPKKENEGVIKKDLDKSEHITNVSHLNEENLNRQGLISDKNINISNMASFITMNNFNERKASLDNEPEENRKDSEESRKELEKEKDNNSKLRNSMNWEEFLQYMKGCCQRREIPETASKFFDILQNLPLDSIKGMIAGSSQLKDQEIQTSLTANNTPKNTENSKKDPGNKDGEVRSRKNSKNLQIEIESENEEEKKNDESKSKNPGFIKIEDPSIEKPKKEPKIAEQFEDRKDENQPQSIKKPIQNTSVEADSRNLLAALSKIGDLRRAFGSEQLLRTQSLSFNPSPSGNKTPTIFEHEPFREFTSKKIREFLNKENMLNLIRFREKALALRHQAQIEQMKKMLDNKRVSPRTFKSKSEEIEKWVNQEREDMLSKKREIEKGWVSAALTIRRTQRDLMFMRKSLGKQDKLGFMEFKHSFSEEDFELFEGIEENGRSSLELNQLNRLEIQDEVLKASNEKNKEKGINGEKSEPMVQKFVMEGNFPKIDDLASSVVNRQLTSESVNTPKVNNYVEVANSLVKNLIHTPDNKNDERLLKIEELKSNESIPDGIELIKQKIADIPKFLCHEDMGNLSGSSSFSLSNSKSDVMFLTSKNKEVDKKIELLSGLVFDQILDELRGESKIFDLLKGKKIVVPPYSQKSPKVGGFVAGKDIQEHFPPLNSPSREDALANKRFKDQILSPKNLNQYRVKSEPDEKVARGNQGILSNIEAVKEYSTELIELVKRKYREQFIRNINVPLGLVPLEKLKLLQLNLNNDSTSSSDVYENSYMYPAFYKEPILSVEIFTDLEKVLFKKDCLANKKRIYELQQIHNKAIFDSFNEALDVLRPFGLKGRPSPWRPVSRQIVLRPVEEKGMDDVLNKAKEKLLEWSSNLCGFIHDKEESPFLEGILLDDECLGQIREDRMARMLAQEVIECEEEWVEYGDEETEVGVELGDLVFEKMLSEGIESILSLKEKRLVAGYFNNFST